MVLRGAHRRVSGPLQETRIRHFTSSLSALAVGCLSMPLENRDAQASADTPCPCPPAGFTRASPPAIRREAKREGETLPTTWDKLAVKPEVPPTLHRLAEEARVLVRSQR